MKLVKFLPIVVLCVFANVTNIYSQAAADTASRDSVKTETIKVKGISCSNDLESITGNIQKVNGVKACKTGKPGATSTFIVTYNPLLASKKDIISAVENTPCCKNPDERPYKVKQ